MQKTTSGGITIIRELAQRVNLSPRYASRKAGELNDALWRLAKSFFLRYNEANGDCVFVIDEDTKTVTARTAREFMAVVKGGI